MCADVNATAGSWCINYLQQLLVTPLADVIGSCGVWKVPLYSTCVCGLNFPRRTSRFWEHWCDRIHENTQENDLSLWRRWRERCEEMEPQLLLCSELLAELHLLVDRCRVVTVTEQLSSVWSKTAGRGSTKGRDACPRGHVRASSRIKTIANNQE